MTVQNENVALHDAGCNGVGENGGEAHSGLSHNQQRRNSPAQLLQRAGTDDPHDFICIGFGPAALAIAVALHDALEARSSTLGSSVLPRHAPKVAFLERQSHFAWHSGMQVPGAKMQITFMKDLATLRDPRSQYTFVNYLHRNNRLVSFMNLGTFLPLREEYEDYMRWCAESFRGVVDYDTEVVDILPEKSASGKIGSFNVAARNVQSGRVENRRAKHVIIAAGGKPHIPRGFPRYHPSVIPSAYYVPRISSEFKKHDAAYRFAVVGAGQSAAEIFNDLQTRYPNCKSKLIIRGDALRPSDDSPFVNEIFDPSRVDSFYSCPAAIRSSAIALDRGTNYGVVRLELLESIYHNLYYQRMKYPCEEQWPHQILNFRSVMDVEPSNPSSTLNSGIEGIRLRLQNHGPVRSGDGEAHEEVLDVDAVVVAAGYERNTHEELLRNCRQLIPRGDVRDGKLQVTRDYRVPFHDGAVAENAAIWTQGCNEDTHGLSDTLLSILATRGGEMVENIFGKRTNVLNGIANKVNGVNAHA